MAKAAKKKRDRNSPERIENRLIIDRMIKEQYAIDTLVEPWIGIKLVVAWVIMFGFGWSFIYLLYIMIKRFYIGWSFVKYSIVGQSIAWHSSTYILNSLGIPV